METIKAKCPNCGTDLDERSVFCENCGALVARAENSQSENSNGERLNQKNKKNPISWNANLPLITSSVVIKQLLFALVVSNLCVLIFILTVDAFSGDLTLQRFLNYVLYTLIIFGSLSVLAALVMLVFYGNRYEYKFTLDETGITSETVGKTKKKNAIINFLLIFSGKPGPAGTGLLAASRQKEKIAWSKVDRIQTDANKLEIVLRRKGRAIMLIRCTPENYAEVLRRANEAVNSQKK